MRTSFSIDYDLVNMTIFIVAILCHITSISRLLYKPNLSFSMKLHILYLCHQSMAYHIQSHQQDHALLHSHKNIAWRTEMTKQREAHFKWPAEIH